MERYDSVMEALAKAQEWPLVHILTKASPDDRVSTLTEMTLVATERHDDQKALALFGWLMHAAADVALVPVFAEHPRDWAKQAEAKRIAQVTKGDLASGLYPNLPDAMDSTQFIRTDQDGSGHMEPCRRPTLVKLRQAIFAEVVRGWGVAEEGKPEEREFEFLSGYLRFPFSEYLLAFKEGLREATDRNFPTARLALALRRLAAKELGEGGTVMVEIFGLAWIRNSRPEEVASFLGMSHFVPKPDLPLRKLLFAQSEEAARAREVVEAVRRAIGCFSGFDAEYLGSRSLRIVFRTTLHGARDENRAHEVFQAALREASKLRERFPGFGSIELVYGAYQQYGSEPYVRRETTLRF